MDRRNILASLCLAGLASPMLGSAAVVAEGRSPGGAIIAQFAAMLSAHDINAFAALFADGYVNHQASAAAPPPSSGVTPKQGTVRFFAARLRAMPDLEVAIEASVVNGNMAAASFVYQGSQTGIYLGVQPTGRRLRFSSCDIFRVADGKIAEHWGMGDIAGVMAQLRGA